MTGDQFDAQGEAHEALSTAVTSYGARVLSDPRILGNLVTDLLPDAPRERSLLVTAAEAGVASELSQHVEQEHLNVDTAIAMVARGLTESRSIDMAASTWVATEYAQALGYQARSARSVPPAQFDAGPAPMTDTVRRPRYSPQPEPFGAPLPQPQSPVTPSFPPPQSGPPQAPPQSPVIPPFPQPQSPVTSSFPPPQSAPPLAPPQSPVTPLFPQPSQSPAPTVWSPTATVSHPGTAVPPANPGYPGYPGPAAPPGSAVPPVAFPYAPVPGPYGGYTAPTFPGSTGTGGRRKRKGAVIAGVAAAVVVAGCVGLVLALLPGPGPKPPAPHPTVALRGAAEVAAFTPPAGGTFHYGIFSTDGTVIAATGGAGHGSSIYIFSATTHKYVTTLKMPGGGTAYPLSFTPDDQALIAVDGTSSSTWNMYIFILKTGKTNGSVQVPDTAYGVDDNGSVEANETLNAKFIDVWNLQSGKFTGHFPNPTAASTIPASLDVTRDGSEMLISAANGEAYVMSTQTGQAIATIPFHYVPNGPVPVLSPDGKTVYIPGSKSTPPQIWSVATGANVTPKNPNWPKTDNGVIYSTDGTVAVTTPYAAPLIDVWNVDLGSHVTRATIPGSNLWQVEAIGPSGDEVLFGTPPDKNSDSARLYLYSVP